MGAPSICGRGVGIIVLSSPPYSPSLYLMQSHSTLSKFENADVRDFDDVVQHNEGFACKVREIVERKVQPLSDMMCADILVQLRMLWAEPGGGGGGGGGGAASLVVDELLVENVLNVTRALEECIDILVVEVHEMLPAAMEHLPLKSIAQARAPRPYTAPVEIAVVASKVCQTHARAWVAQGWEVDGKAKLAARQKKQQAAGYQPNDATFV